MKIRQTLIMFLLAFAGFPAGAEETLRSGDLVFQDTGGAQGRAVKIATGSRFSHVGLVEVTDRGVFVIEAVEPVQVIAWKKFISRDGGRYTVVRLKRPLSQEQYRKVLAAARSFLGHHYDPLFGWGDDQLYCSELVYKAYLRGADLSLSGLKKLSDFRLDHPEVRKLLTKRYGKSIPLEEPVISPEDLFRSSLVRVIRSH